MSVQPTVLNVTVTSAAGGGAISGADVELFTSADGLVSQALTDASGVAVFNIASSGSYYVKVVTVGYQLFKSATFTVDVITQRTLAASAAVLPTSADITWVAYLAGGIVVVSIAIYAWTTLKGRKR